MNKTPFIIFAALWLFTSCRQKEQKQQVFLDPNARDTTVRAQDNFFLYANGTWLKKTVIPASESGWGSFYTLENNNQQKLKNLLDNLSSKKHAPGTLEQKVGDYYAAGMDTVAIEKAGAKPIQPLLRKLAEVKDYKQLIYFVTADYRNGAGYLFDFSVNPDDKNSGKYMANFYQSGLDLPEKDYYFRNDSASNKIRLAYVSYIEKMLKLTGYDSQESQKEAKQILALETLIAKAHRTPVELRDPNKNYNKYTVKQIETMMPDLSWPAILNTMGIKTDTVLISQPRYYQELDRLIKAQPLNVWKDKIRFNIADHYARYLSSPFRNARFDFYGRVLSGSKQQQPRWKTVSRQVDGGLGELLGQLFVKDYFKRKDKQRMLELVNNLQMVYRSRIEKLDWMSAATKQKALAKLSAFTKKIGYPDKWKNYDDVTISRNNYFANTVSTERHNYQETIAKLAKPVDRTEWGMTPPTVNAYYNPGLNEIVFPAGILQPPFYFADADDAVNYGSIGAIIGHEMTHGFDDQGKQYDKDGNLKDWWTKEDAVKFSKKVKLIIDEYNSYTVLNNLHVNGQLTQGENLADIGGLAIAYQAFKRTKQGKSTDKIDGLTPDQRFFLAFAQAWQIKERDEETRTRITTDPHSPEMYRTNGPLSNMPAFYQAFGVKPGDKMYRPDSLRVKVW
ncbi:M13 family metallopeptidase [Mucilaginibacter sp. CSA2-8R]|uniref:M13 family metallopeptidase n=1 Tax=Mucilaginibacter sp. CSA2-8R TaxID=3141542 RepID=UPI00315CE994